MLNLLSKRAEDRIKQIAQNPGQGYGAWSHYNETADIYHERLQGDVSNGTSPWSRTNLFPRERMQNYRKLIDEGMRDEWGEDKGVKPSGTDLVRKKKKKKKRDRRRKDLGYITEYERRNRSNPKFVGRVQKHWRRKNDYSKGKSPYDEPGAWPHMRDYPKLPSWEPETWKERSERDMHL